MEIMIIDLLCNLYYKKKKSGQIPYSNHGILKCLVKYIFSQVCTDALNNQRAWPDTEHLLIQCVL